MNLKEKGCPDALQAFGQVFTINTDFRVWLRYPSVLSDDLSLVFPKKAPPITQDVVDQLDEFYNPTCVVPKSEESAGGVQLVDWDVDANLIFAAFMQAYGIDLTEADLHWHKFKALFDALPEETLLVKVMQYRGYKGSDKDMKALQRTWELPVKLTEEEQEQLDEFDKYF